MMGYSKNIDTLARYEHFPDPLTMTILALTGVAVGTAGEIRAGEAQAAEAGSQKRIARFNAQIAEREAQLEQQQIAKQAQSQISAARARSGASGVLPEGAPLAIESAISEEAELAQLLVEFRSNIEQQITGMQVKQFGKQQKNVRQAAAIKATGTLLEGFGKVHQADESGMLRSTKKTKSRLSQQGLSGFRRPRPSQKDPSRFHRW